MFSIPHVLIAVLLLSSVTFSHTAFSDDSTSNYEKALQSFHEKDYETSIIYVRNALQQDNENLPARILYAEILLVQGNNKLAEKALIEAQTANADLRLIQPLFAQLYLNEKEFDKVLVITPPSNSGKAYLSDIYTFKGHANLGKKDFQAAKKAYQLAIAQAPKNLNAYVGLAKVAVERKDFEAAEQWISKASSINPNDMDVLFSAALVYKLQKKNEQAITYTDKILERHPEHLNALLVRAVVYSEMGEHEKAIDDVDTIIEIVPFEPVTNYVKSMSALAMNDMAMYNESNEQLGNIISGISTEIIEKQPIYLFLAGLSTFQQGAYEQAKKHLTRYHKYVPKDVNGLKLLAKTHIALGSYGEAKGILIQEHLYGEPDLDIISLLGRIELLSNNFERAEYYFNQALTLAPNSLHHVISLAKVYMLRGNHFDAAKLAIKYQDSIQNNEQGVELLFILAKSFQEIREYPQGLLAAQRLVAYAPKNSSAQQQYATLLALNGKLAEAKHTFLLAHSLDQSNFLPVISLARIDIEENKPGDAVRRLKSQLSLGDNSALFIELANIYQRYGDSKNAILYFEKALEHNANSVLAIKGLSYLYARQKELKKALALATDFLDRNKNNEEIHRLAAELYAMQNQRTHAVKHMETVVKLSANKAPQLFELAKLHLSYGGTDMATMALQRAISWQDNYVPAYELLISLYNESKAEKDSLKYIEKLAKFDEQKHLVLRLKGDLFWMQDKQTEARQSFEQSYRSKPTKEAVIGLYRLNRKQGKHQENIALLNTWLADQPNDVTMSAMIAESYYLLGEPDNAIAHYQLLLNKQPNNIVLLNNIAQILLSTQKVDQAFTYADKAYSIAKESVPVIDTRAWVAYHQEDYDLALQLLRKANSLDFENAEINYHLAATLDKQGKREEAQSYLESAVSSDMEFTDKDKARALLTSWQE
ncbi:XrtA/PEP-CTERM system TPR-repeat protein PrsT [Thalassotalea euphylliae]|uniref:XrtA/PEP-CTERM system TPR-repeat protein PrsT n=1 Tax=Thalassotalea euphylliae TaxID=1655234 RepID=UPI00363CF968